MIDNDDELNGTRARIAYFQDLLAQIRVAARADLFPSMASGYCAEIEKLQGEVLEYLTRHVSQPPPAEVAEADDFDKEVRLLGKSKKFQRFLKERSKEAATTTLEDYRRSLD